MVQAAPAETSLVLEPDRQLAFVRAGRHSRVVRLLRVTFPIVACALIGGYALYLGGRFALSSSGIQFERQEITERDLKMINPNYRGLTKDGGQFEVRASEAVVDLALSGPIKLDAVIADLIDAKGVTTTVRGAKGVVDRAKSTVDLTDGVTVETTSGMTARMQTAHVNTKENRVRGHTGVVTSFPTGTVRADAMDFLTKARKGTYTGNVLVDLKPQQPPANAAPKAKDQPTKASTLGLSPDAREPISVRAQRLDIDDGARRADFLGGVTATQGTTRIDSETLHLDYEGQPPAPGGAASKKKDEIANLLDPAASAGRFKRMKAQNNVVITSADERRITAEAADFDVATDTAVLTGNVHIQQPASSVRALRLEANQKADTALLTGNVLVEQGSNKLSGQRLAIDRKKGTARLDSPAEGTGRPGRIQTTFVQQQPAGQAPRAKSDTLADKKSSRANPFGGMRSDPNAPLDVDAETLDVADQQKVAIFRGSVNAKQGDMHLRASELHAFYTGEGGLMADTSLQRKAAAGEPKTGEPKTGEPKTGEPKTGAQLTRVEARSGVTIDARDGQSASGDKATFDVKANTVLIEGNVIMTQAQNTIKCARANMDLTSGVMRCERDPAPPVTTSAAPQGPQPVGLTPAPGQQMQMVIFPKDVREKQQARDADKKTAPANERTAPPRTQRRQPDRPSAPSAAP